MLMHSLGRDGAMIGMILSWTVVAVTQWWFVAKLLSRRLMLTVRSVRRQASRVARASRLGRWER